MACRPALRFRLSDWNDIIEEANSRTEGCESTLPLLDLLTAPHKWSVSDITTVRDRAGEICVNDPTFIAPLVKWNRAAWLELHEALAIYNCDCGCTPGYAAMIASLDGGYSYLPHTATSWNPWYTQVSEDPIRYQWHLIAETDFSQSNGQMYGYPTVSGANHEICGFVNWHDSSGYGYVTHSETIRNIGTIVTDCDGIVTNGGPAYFQFDFPTGLGDWYSMYPIGVDGVGIDTRWDTSGATCC